MERQIEGLRAVAEAVALSRPGLVSARQAAPASEILAALAAMAADHAPGECRLVAAESESAAVSAAISAAEQGARAYTATASQGLMRASEAVYHAAGRGLPIVMTVADRAGVTPVSLAGDHSDAMWQRDSGWIQLYPQTAQEAADLHLQAFRIAEDLSAPVMVCLDGSLLSDVIAAARLPSQDEADRFLPAPRPPRGPAGPDTCRQPLAEFGYLTHARQLRALGLIPEVTAEFQAAFGREAGGLARAHRLEDAQTAVVALGSAVETAVEAADALRAEGVRVGVLALTAYRPFPLRAVRRHLAGCRRLVVVERALAPGLGGILTSDVESAMRPSPMPVHTVIPGLGGRPATVSGLRRIFAAAHAGALRPLTFLDFDSDQVARQLLRGRLAPRKAVGAVGRTHGAEMAGAGGA